MPESGGVRVARKQHTIDDRIVTLRVGGSESQRHFSVHEAILRQNSSFFRAALDKKWREGRSRQIDLPHDDGDVVAAFVDWLYFGKVASKPVAPPELPMDDGEYTFLARLYSFGDKVQSDSFCNIILDAMTSKTDDVTGDGTRTFPSHTAITALYNGTPSDSPARRFVVDMYLEFGTEKWVPQEADLNHAEFLTDLVRAFLTRNEGKTIRKQTNYSRRQRWHKSETDEEFLQASASGGDMKMEEPE